MWSDFLVHSKTTIEIIKLFFRYHIIQDGTSIGESWSCSHPAGHPQQHSDLAANIQVNCNLKHSMIIFHSRYNYVMMYTITI